MLSCGVEISDRRALFLSRYLLRYIIKRTVYYMEATMTHHSPINYKNLTGLTFNRLTVLKRMPDKRLWMPYYWCQCVCGTIREVRGSHLTLNKIQSCGCLNQELKLARGRHFLSKHILYKRFEKMKARCTNPNNPDYHHYGGRGIGIYEPWQCYPEDFINYIITLYPDWKTMLINGYSIDRINNDGNYEPGNLRLATPKEQANNRRKRAYAKLNA